MKSYARRVGEDRIGRCERNESDLRHARGGPEQKLLGHPHLEEPLGVGVAEDVHVGVLREVRREPDDARVGLGQGGKRVTEGRGCRLLAGVGEGGDHRRGLELRLGGGAHDAAPSAAAAASDSNPAISCSRQIGPLVLVDAHEMRLLARLEQWDAATDLRVADEDVRCADGVAVADRVEGAQQRLGVVPVDPLGVPAERCPLLFGRFDVEDSGGGPVCLKGIHVDERDQISEPVGCRAHRGLPRRAFVQLSVGEEVDDPRPRSAGAGGPSAMPTATVSP